MLYKGGSGISTCLMAWDLYPMEEVTYYAQGRTSAP